MVQSCCIKNCKSEWIRNGDISFHSFPKNPESFTAFVSAIPPNLIGKITKFSKICSKHFSADSFSFVSTPNLRNRLKSNAVPTLFEDDLNSSTPTTPIDVVEHSANDTAVTDNRMIVDSTHSAPFNTIELDQEETSNCDSLHSATLQLKPTVSIEGQQEVGVQTLHQYLSPSDEVIQLRKKIRMLRKRLQRRDTRIKTMSNLVRHLKKHGESTDAIEDVLKNRFSGFAFDILANELKNDPRTSTEKRYSKEVKSFALKLYSYSPKAYDFTRTKLNLPHSSMIRKWLNRDCGISKRKKLLSNK